MSTWGSNQGKPMTMAQMLKSKNDAAEAKKAADKKAQENKKKTQKVEVPEVAKIQITKDYPNFVINALNVKRFSVKDIYALRTQFTDLPEGLTLGDNNIVIGYEAVCKSNSDFEEAETNKNLKAKDKYLKAINEVPVEQSEKKTESETELKATEKPWSAESSDNSTINDLKELRSLLNKVSLENVYKITPSILTIIQKSINNTKALTELLTFFISKASDDTSFYIVYGIITKSIYSELSVEDAKIFINTLINLCQASYEKYNNVALSAAGSYLPDEIQNNKSMRRGLVRYIGELYVNNLISTPVVKFMINDLGYRYIDDEDSVECLLQFLQIVAPVFDVDKKKRVYMNGVFKALLSWEHKRELSSRLIYLLRAIRDLRGKEWKNKDELYSEKDLELVDSDEEGWESVETVKKEKTQKKHAKKQRKEKKDIKEKSQEEVDPEVLALRSFWIDLVADRMIDMAIVSLSSMDDETKVKLVASLIRTIPARSEYEQKAVYPLISELITDEGLTKEIVKTGLLACIADYSDVRRKEHAYLPIYFSRMFLQFFIDGTLSFEDIFENWKSSDDNAIYLLELLTTLLKDIKATNPTLFNIIVSKKLLTIKSIFGSNYTEIYISRMLEKFGYTSKCGVLNLN
ncbi:hypothetical protein WA158_005275 [Blastocystis sp. Blastoise]